jgi:hypothetical protein
MKTEPPVTDLLAIGQMPTEKVVDCTCDICREFGSQECNVLRHLARYLLALEADSRSVQNDSAVEPAFHGDGPSGSG